MRSYVNFKKISLHDSNFLKRLIETKNLKMDWDMLRDLVAERLRDKKINPEKLFQISNYIFHNNYNLVQKFGNSKDEILENISSAVLSFINDLLDETKIQQNSALYIRNILLRIAGGGESMTILEWIDKTIKDNKNFPKFVNFLQTIKEHYLRNYSPDENIRETAVSLDLIKKMIESVLNRHEEFNIDLDSLRKATDAFLP